MNLSFRRDYHQFRFSRANMQECFPEDVFQEVIATEAFRRLKSIHFLGAIDYLMFRGGAGVEQRHTRYDHSLAVGFLAKRFAQAKGIVGKEYETIVIGALLHDIGHAPLSHSLEPAFRSIFEIDHHKVGERILTGQVRPGVRLAKVLEQNGVNNFEVMALISGVGRGVGKELFSRSINVDTIEGIIRSASYLIRRELILSPVKVLDALADLGPESAETLDEFWLMKDWVYATIIQSKVGLVADYMCKRYMEINSQAFNSSYYYGTEAELKRDHGALFRALDSFGRNNEISPDIVRDGEEVHYMRRKFFIDPSVVLNEYADLDRRYLQRREKVVSEIKKTGGEVAHGAWKHSGSQSLFGKDTW